MTVSVLKSTVRRPFPWPESAGIVLDTLGLAVPGTYLDLEFNMRRRKEGTEIGFRLGKFWWNVSYQTGHYPATFSEARTWVKGYAARYGWPDPIEFR